MQKEKNKDAETNEKNGSIPVNRPYINNLRMTSYELSSKSLHREAPINDNLKKTGMMLRNILRDS